ncbi:MAG: bifunctional riboflavin kinase/FAD synthetase [Deltaproteobacteria bacterium]|nr:bifunctional riboflavin kinase/FAD synthetase [Deltaproteobacteria bacterium]
MECVYDYNELRADTARPRIVTIGNFDGVHLGHQAVLAKARRDARRHGVELAVLTFEPHPAELLKPSGPRLRLVEPERKAELLAECGADLLLAQRFDREFAELSAERFTADVLVRSLGATEVIVGENFRFGRGRVGDVDALREFGKAMDFQVRGEQLVRSRKADISSSRIRQLLQLGNPAVAGILLGRPHEIPGTVMPGRKEGRNLGFPTINLGDVRVLVPGPGIYAAFCDIEDDTVMAAAYIGDRPTMGHGFSIEAHLLDYDNDLYGQRVVLRFIERVREDMKFANLDQLKEQMSRDVDLIHEILENIRD